MAQYSPVFGTTDSPSPVYQTQRADSFSDLAVEAILIHN